MLGLRVVTLSILFVALAISVSGYKPVKTGGERPCGIAFRCSNEEDVVWASDGNQCTVWRNACQLANENCQRQNRYAEVLKNLPKEECQKMCATVCTADYRPVCAEYKGVERTFSNACQLSVHICTSGETYSLHREGECVKKEE